MLNALTKKQQVMVKTVAPDALQGLVDPALILDFRALNFEKLLGSGSFGDCFKGYHNIGQHRVPVAIKKMRVGEF